MKENIIGVDIGGTKCAVTYGQQGRHRVTILDKECFRTSDVTQTIEQLKTCIRNVMGRHGLEAGNTRAIGISCGGPLDSRTGVVMSPPNLPGWDNIPIVGIFEKEFGIRTAIHNDANACALAEWQFGAGAGTRNMIFLTFGTGLGAGLILDGRIYTGTNDNAGELGHIRLSDFGPVGYGKCGSFEGFCSGGGIRQLAQFAVKERLQMGEKVAWCPEGDPDRIDARLVAQAAAEGDALALEIYRTSARYLGRGAVDRHRPHQPRDDRHRQHLRPQRKPDKTLYGGGHRPRSALPRPARLPRGSRGAGRGDRRLRRAVGGRQR